MPKKFCALCGQPMPKTIRGKKATARYAPDVIRHIHASRRKKVWLAREYGIPLGDISKIKKYVTASRAVKAMATYDA